jgi:NAD(P)-dependent dehydrogenase (short-subunit alcohol dehydrogenase family)
VASTIRELGRIDILINMASLSVAKTFDLLTAEDWDRQMTVDLRATFLFSHAVVPRDAEARRRPHHQLHRLGGGQRAADIPVTAYVAKAGVKALTESLALELRARKSSSTRSRRDRSSRRRTYRRRKASPSSRAHRSAAGAAKREIARR